MARGIQTDKGHIRHQHVAQDCRGRWGHGQQVQDSKGGKRRYKQWRPADGGDVQVDGSSAPRRVGEEKQVQERSGAALSGDRWRSG